MADIMISCPIFGKAVPTGITTEMIILNTLDFSLTSNVRLAEKSTNGLDQTHGLRKSVQDLKIQTETLPFGRAVRVVCRRAVSRGRACPHTNQYRSARRQ
jgi:hypothetical protein